LNLARLVAARQRATLRVTAALAHALASPTNRPPMDNRSPGAPLFGSAPAPFKSDRFRSHALF
jgi:hypothetical protein